MRRAQARVMPKTHRRTKVRVLRTLWGDLADQVTSPPEYVAVGRVSLRRHAVDREEARSHQKKRFANVTCVSDFRCKGDARAHRGGLTASHSHRRSSSRETIRARERIRAFVASLHARTDARDAWGRRPRARRGRGEPRHPRLRSERPLRRWRRGLSRARQRDRAERARAPLPASHHARSNARSGGREIRPFARTFSAGLDAVNLAKCELGPWR